MFTFSDQTLSITNSQAYADWVAANFVGNQASSQNIFINFTLYNANSGKSLALTISGQQLEFTKAIVLSGVTGVANINMDEISNTNNVISITGAPEFDVSLPALAAGTSYTVELNSAQNLYSYTDGKLYPIVSHFEASFFNNGANTLSVYIGSENMMSITFDISSIILNEITAGLSGTATATYDSETNSTNFSIGTAITGSIVTYTSDTTTTTQMPTDQVNAIVKSQYGTTAALIKSLIQTNSSSNNFFNMGEKINDTTSLNNIVSFNSATYKDGAINLLLDNAIILSCEAQISFNYINSADSVSIVSNVESSVTSSLVENESSTPDYYAKNFQLKLGKQLTSLSLSPFVGSITDGVYNVSYTNIVEGYSNNGNPFFTGTTASGADISVYYLPSIIQATNNPSYQISYGSSKESSATIYYNESTGEFVSSSSDSAADPFVINVSPSTSSTTYFNNMNNWTLQLGSTSAGLYGLTTTADGQNTYDSLQALFGNGTAYASGTSAFSLSTFNSDYGNKVFNFSVVGGYFGANVNTNGQTYSTSNQLEITFVPVNVA